MAKDKAINDVNNLKGQITDLQKDLNNYKESNSNL